jgi:hypothetical protein
MASFGGWTPPGPGPVKRPYGDPSSAIPLAGKGLSGGVSLDRGLRPLHFPRREAAQVEMEQVHAGRGAIMRELQFVLHLLGPDALPANRAGYVDPLATPCAIGVAPGDPARLKDAPRERADALFVGHRNPHATAPPEALSSPDSTVEGSDPWAA